MQLSPSVQARFGEIERRNKVVPIQFKDIAQGALAGAQTAESLQADRDKKAKALEFQKLLDAGLPAMQQVHQELADPSMPDPSLFTDSRDAVVSWYKLADEKLTQKREGLGRTQVGQHLAAGQFDQAGGAAVSSGLTKDPAAMIAAGRKTAAEEKEAKRKADAQAAWRADLEGDYGPRAGKLGSDKKARNTLVADIYKKHGDLEEAHKFIDDIDSQAPQTAGTHGSAGLEHKKSEDFQQRVRLVKKDLEPKVKIAQAFVDVNKAIPGGIDSAKDASGYGIGAKPFRKWFMGEESAKLRAAVATLTNIVLKDRSGAAVTDQELGRIEEELGLSATSPVSAFLDALRRKRDNLREEMENDENTDPEAAAELKKRGYKGSALLTFGPAGGDIRLTGDKAKRLAELRAKKAEGTLK